MRVAQCSLRECGSEKRQREGEKEKPSGMARWTIPLRVGLGVDCSGSRSSGRKLNGIRAGVKIKPRQ